MMIRTSENNRHKTTSFIECKRSIVDFQYLNCKTIIIYDLKTKQKAFSYIRKKQFDIDNQMNTFAEITTIKKKLKKVA
jgi:hypothetical protein